MSQHDMGFPWAEPIHRVCSSSAEEYPWCGLTLPNIEANFGPCACKNPRCNICKRLWETIYQRALKSLEHFMDLRDSDMEINKDIRGRFYRHLTKHFQPIYRAAIDAGTDLEKMKKVWDWEARSLVIGFVDEVNNVAQLFPNVTKRGVQKNAPTHLLYVFNWIWSNGRVHRRGGCPFGVTNDIKRRRLELAKKDPSLHLKLHAIWDVGRQHVFPIETAMRRWNEENNQIWVESLDMDIEDAMPFIEGYIAKFRNPMPRGEGD